MGFTGRTADKSTKQILAVARRALAQVDTIDYLFVPDYYMVPFVITLAAERGIQLGPELKLVTIDWNEDRRVQGILCLRQRWDLMFEAALRWATSELPPHPHLYHARAPEKPLKVPIATELFPQLKPSPTIVPSSNAGPSFSWTESTLGFRGWGPN